MYYMILYPRQRKIQKDLKTKFAKNALLHENVKELEKDHFYLNVLAKRLLTKNKVCFECETYKAKNDELSKALQSFTNSKTN